MDSIENVVLELYALSKVDSLTEGRLDKFTMSTDNDLRKLPPGRDALTLHTKRACYQAGYLWREAMGDFPLPDPTLWGWYRKTLNLVEFSLISLSVHVFVEQRSVRTANVLKSLLNVSSLVSVEGSVAMHNCIELLLYHYFIMAFVNICIFNSENGIILTPFP